jgi:hypothetical protein
MNNLNQKSIEQQINNILKQNGLPEQDYFIWNPLPFSGVSGTSTSFYQYAATIARQYKNGEITLPSPPLNAQDIAKMIFENLDHPAFIQC